MTHNHDVRTSALAAPAALIRLDDVRKEYGTGSQRFTALSAITLELHRGECVAVVGKSGSGKTTLVNLLTGIDTPTAGHVHVGNHAIHDMSQEQLAAWRGRTVGIVFQFFQLLPTLTVAENVMLPMDFCDTFAAADRRPRALALLDRLGIADQADKIPADVSGGQQQRAAIARALANDPPLIVADEPTGNLDTATSIAVMSFLASLAAEGRTVVTVTHEATLSEFFSRTITLSDGAVASDVQRVATPAGVA
jgi:putative ABC transport system ATP-binding protein